MLNYKFIEATYRILQSPTLVVNLACETKRCSFRRFIGRFSFLPFLVVFDKNGQGPLQIASMVYIPHLGGILHGGLY